MRTLSKPDLTIRNFDCGAVLEGCATCVNVFFSFDSLWFGNSVTLDYTSLGFDEEALLRSELDQSPLQEDVYFVYDLIFTIVSQCVPSSVLRTQSIVLDLIDLIVCPMSFQGL